MTHKKAYPAYPGVLPEGWSHQPIARDCQHGQQRGKCALCDYAEEIAELKAERNLDRTILDQYQEELNTAEGAVADLMTVNEQAEARIQTLEAAIRAHRTASKDATGVSYSDDMALWALVPEEHP